MACDQTLKKNNNLLLLLTLRKKFNRILLLLYLLWHFESVRTEFVLRTISSKRLFYVAFQQKEFSLFVLADEVIHSAKVSPPSLQLVFGDVLRVICPPL